MGPRDVEIGHIGRKKVDVLLHSLQADRTGVVQDLKLKQVPACRWREVDSIGVLVESGDVDEVVRKGEGAIGASHRDHKGVQSVSAWETLIIKNATQWHAGRVTSWIES